MAIFSAGQLARFKARHDASLDSTCVILRPTRTRDGAGGWMTADVPVGTPICRYEELQRQPQEQVGGRGDAGVIVAISDWELRLPAGTDIQITDRVQLATVAGTFEVTRVATPSHGCYTRAELLRFDS